MGVMKICVANEIASGYGIQRDVMIIAIISVSNDRRQYEEEIDYTER